MVKVNVQPFLLNDIHVHNTSTFMVLCVCIYTFNCFAIFNEGDYLTSISINRKGYNLCLIDCRIMFVSVLGTSHLLSMRVIKASCSRKQLTGALYRILTQEWPISGRMLHWATLGLYTLKEK